MILDLPPHVQMQIEHTAKAQGVTAEQLAVLALTRQFSDEHIDFDIKTLQSSIDSGFTPAIPDHAVQDVEHFEKWLRSV
ncbi:MULTISPECIES: hypothetical protein [unclassified Acinetobacter]|uniref:hypothetical protein n=1 Tax=unclassified Acinetobacter TaxID=196816 RepID=UPI0035B7D93B